MATSYHVEAEWDAEASAWVSSSNIPGLVVETETLAEFIDIVRVLAPELLAENLGLSGNVPVELRARGRLDLVA